MRPPVQDTDVRPGPGVLVQGGVSGPRRRDGGATRPSRRATRACSATVRIEGFVAVDPGYLPTASSASCRQSMMLRLREDPRGRTRSARPGTMSSNWPRCTSMMEVHHLRVRHRLARPNRVSSRPSAATAPTRSPSAASSASPQASRPVRGVPIATQLGGHISHRTGVAAHSDRRPPRRPRCQRGSSGRDLFIDLGERPHRAARRGAPPAALVPHQAHRAPERSQIHQPDRAAALGPHRPAADPTGRPRRWCLDVHAERRTRCLVDSEHLHIAQTDQQLTDPRRVLLHRGPPPNRCTSHPIPEAPQRSRAQCPPNSEGPVVRDPRCRSTEAPSAGPPSQWQPRSRPPCLVVIGVS